jgi:hypothetical protein
MRFHAHGPDIPLPLIEARDRGEVIFLCGAGVSIPAGLPSFVDLARRVVEDLGAPRDGTVRQLLAHAMMDGLATVPLDQVFDRLKDDYGAARVEAAVTRRLRAPRSADLSRHQLVMRLSADDRGRARLVTTNFDPLFDRLSGRRARFVPPHLPELGFGGSFEGVVYLHGRVDGAAVRAGALQGLVLSSADFGRAYLAQGWATRFMRQLLDRFTLVLLGYAADDPPVRYLLQGLRDEPTREGALYAFAAGDPGVLDARWRARGVRAMAYEATDPAHSNLWRSLGTWADRAETPAVWQGRLLGSAAAGPRAVEPHVRGQVAALLQSAAGARAWAETNPPPPAEWLCVMDNRLRFSPIRRSSVESSSEPFDSLAAYGLDSDPPRPAAARPDTVAPGLNLLAPLPADRRDAAASSVVTIGRPTTPLPPRLRQLSRWMAQVADDPLALWWAAGQPSLHPDLIDALERAVVRPPEGASPERLAVWCLLLEAKAGSEAPHRQGWYELDRQVREGGWTEAALRKLPVVLRPRLICERPSASSSQPPDSTADVRALAHLEVAFLDVHQPDTRITDSVLTPALAHWRSALSIGASLLRDLRPRFWRPPSLLPPAGGTKRGHASDAGHFVLSFVRLLDRLAACDVAAARREIQSWPLSEPYLFDPLRLWAAHRVDLTTPDEAAEIFDGLNEAAFWNEGGARDVLLTIRTRWPDLPESDRRRLEMRILAGPPPWPDEAPASHARRSAIAAATRLGWLQAEGCELSQSTAEALPGLRAADPRWNPAWDQAVARSHEPQVGWVETTTDPGDLLDAPLSTIASRAATVAAERPGQFVQADPFKGLVEQRPGRAMAALAYEARHGAYPIELWETLLNHKEPLPEPRHLGFLGRRLAQLPGSVLLQLRHSAPDWLDRNIIELAQIDPGLPWTLWDTLFAGVVSGEDGCTESALGEVLLGAFSQPRSRRTFEHALNSPIGTLTQALIRLSSQAGTLAGLSEDARARLRTAMEAPGEGADHAVSIVFHKLPWLFHRDRGFGRELIPRLDPMGSQAEPAWSGYLAGPEIGGPELFIPLRDHYLAAFGAAADWRWSDSPYERLADFLMAIQMSPQPGRFLSAPCAREALQVGGESACRHFLDALLSRADASTWPTVRRVLREVWPQEAALQTEGTASRLIDIALALGEHFPDAVRVMRSLLRPVTSLDLVVHRLAGADDEEKLSLGRRFPQAALNLLEVAVTPGQPVYNLASLLNLLADAAPHLRQTSAWRRLSELALP